MPGIQLLSRRWGTCGLLFVLLFALFMASPQQDRVAALTAHPRLWVRAADLPRLRSWAVDSNPAYRDGLAALTAQAVKAMDSGDVPAKDQGGAGYDDYPTEMYAQLFAFMSLIENDPGKRQDYANRARTLLMFVIGKAAPGASDGQPFRDPEFAISDRSRWLGSGFGLTVDWIYPALTAQDKAAIRTVFLRWIDEDIHAETTSNNHPDPIGVTNDPQLLADPIKVRWSGNNYFNAHMRNIGLMALSFDPADDPDGKLGSFVGNATGAWLYMVDHLLRTDAQGGFAPEGLEYGPQSMGFVAQFLLALHTAGQDDPKVWGPQVVFKDNPYWDASILAYLHSLSPATTTIPDVGQSYLPAWYGDAQNYWTPDFIQQFGPMGIYDQDTGNTKRLNAIRWIELNTAPGGADGLKARVQDQNFFDRAILYFLLLDPATPPPTDPHSDLPLTYYGPGLRRLLARTDWGPSARWFTYNLSWDTIDHQTAGGNAIEFYRKGEWLTMQRIGYDLDYATSDNLNGLAIQNDKPNRDPDDYRTMIWDRGSQWLYIPSGDPPPPLYSADDQFVYAQGDATNLYNSSYESVQDVLHASRSVVWLKPDIIVVYDRAVSKSEGRFKRFWLSLPADSSVSGNVTTAKTTGNQQLFVTTLLPAKATISVAQAQDEKSGPPANNAPMKARLEVEATGAPKSVQFLNVLQGADPDTAAEPTRLITSAQGKAFEGVVVNNTLVLFPVSLSGTFSGVTYSVPATATTQIITGLQPATDYTVTTKPSGDSLNVTIAPGPGVKTNNAGVLVLH